MSKQPCHGFPCVDDPHDFIPDPDCCSPEERETHRRACQTYGHPDHEPNKGCYTEYDKTGTMVKHVTRTSWGIGTNLIAHCDGCGEPTFEDPLITCHECGGPEYCSSCWPKHDADHDKKD